MSVSLVHEELVQKILLWIRVRYAGDDTLDTYAECVLEPHFSRPPKVDKFIPDVAATNGKNLTMIIGEAKTPRDLETPHSREQLIAYMEHLKSYRRGLLIVATPWSSRNNAKSIVRSICRRQDIETVGTVFLTDISNV